MKVAVFTDTFDQVNGVAITYRELIKYCKREQIFLDLYTQSTGKSPDSIEEQGTVRIYRFKPTLPIKWGKDLYFDLQIPNKKILHYFKQEKYRFIHSAATGSIGINALYLSKKFDIPILGSFNTDLPQYAYTRIVKKLNFLSKPIAKIFGRIFRFLLWIYLKGYYKSCDFILAPSECYKLLLEKKTGMPVGLFARGANPDIFNPKKRDQKFRQKYPGILALYVGRLSAEKNVKELIDVFEKRSDITLIVVGEGPYKKEMGKSIPKIVFTGPIIDRAELAVIFASCDIFIFPSRTETFGQVICEAGMSGLPRIVNYSGASKEQVAHGVDGFVYSTTPELHNYINQLKNHYKLRKKMSDKARELSRSRSWDNIFQVLFEQYERLSIDLDMEFYRVHEF